MLKDNYSKMKVVTSLRESLVTADATTTAVSMKGYNSTTCVIGIGVHSGFDASNYVEGYLQVSRDAGSTWSTATDQSEFIGNITVNASTGKFFKIDSTSEDDVDIIFGYIGAPATDGKEMQLRIVYDVTDAGTTFATTNGIKSSVKFIMGDLANGPASN